MDFLPAASRVRDSFDVLVLFFIWVLGLLRLRLLCLGGGFKLRLMRWLVGLEFVGVVYLRSKSS